MEKDQFLAGDGQSWWLIEQQLEYPLEQARQALGTAWAWTDPLWYTEPDKLLELYMWIENNRSDLLRELDEFTDDAERRRMWLETVTHAKAPPADPSAAQEAPGAGAGAAVEEAAAEQATEAAEQAAEPAAAAAAEAAEAPEPKKSIFAKKKAAAEPDVKQQLTEMGADPNIPLEPDEVEEMLNDPDFHTKLAAAEADVEAELEAELAGFEA